mmetsp:Transcript_152120/g.264453  ORF Transcript_152120/g.264453 Transcript_152120/m.264453 type:complete len:107 (+) Transcript_152120:50-370(+)
MEAADVALRTYKRAGDSTLEAYALCSCFEAINAAGDPEEALELARAATLIFQGSSESQRWRKGKGPSGMKAAGCALAGDSREGDRVALQGQPHPDVFCKDEQPRGE